MAFIIASSGTIKIAFGRVRVSGLRCASILLIVHVDVCFLCAMAIVNEVLSRILLL